MAPLTRMRAGEGGVPTPLSAIYYGQRASAAMIITEATAISHNAHGYPNMPGIHSKEQLAGWRAIATRVHQKNGRIVMQIVHTGRASHSTYQTDGIVPGAPSALASASGQAFLPDFTLVEWEVPRALEQEELVTIVASFKTAAKNAIDAGCDAVEIHAANGYLLDQFLQDGSNKRTDQYGGSIENRSRLLLEVVDALVEAIGKNRVAVRLSPHGNFGGMQDSDPKSLFTYVINALSQRHLAYLHLIEPRASSIGLGDDLSIDSANNAKLFRRAFNGPVISAGGYTAASATRAILDGDADAIAFGRSFLANPDLPARVKAGAPLNRYDRTTFYGGAEKGYTDYPSMESAD